MISFWNVTSDKLNRVPIDSLQDKIIFASDTNRVYADFQGSRREYCDMIYVQDINNIPSADLGKSLIYFENSTNKLYFYTGNGYFPLNSNINDSSYIGRYTINQVPNDSILNSFVFTMKDRESKIGDIIIDCNGNQWTKINNLSSGNDWTQIGSNVATYEKMGLISVKEGCGLILSGGILSLNLLDENRLSGQIVTLNISGQIDDDLYEKSPVIQWEDIN